MKKITRNQAVLMFQNIGTMAIGHLDEETLSATLDNLDALRKVHDDVRALSDELAKRLYDGTDQAKKKEFFKVVSLYESACHARDLEKADQNLAIMKDTYADFYPLYEKQVSVLKKIRNKEVEIDLAEIDKEAFIKGIVLGQKDIQIFDIVRAFAPMFKDEDKAETDLAELDELLKD